MRKADTLPGKPRRDSGHDRPIDSGTGTGNATMPHCDNAEFQETGESTHPAPGRGREGRHSAPGGAASRFRPRQADRQWNGNRERDNATLRQCGIPGKQATDRKADTLPEESRVAIQTTTGRSGRRPPSATSRARRAKPDTRPGKGSWHSRDCSRSLQFSCCCPGSREPDQPDYRWRQSGGSGRFHPRGLGFPLSPGGRGHWTSHGDHAIQAYRRQTMTPPGHFGRRQQVRFLIASVYSLCPIGKHVSG